MKEATGTTGIEN